MQDPINVVIRRSGHLLRPGPWQRADWCPGAPGTAGGVTPAAASSYMASNETGLNLSPARSEKAQVCHGGPGSIWMCGLPPERAAMEDDEAVTVDNLTNLPRLTRSKSGQCRLEKE